jgi:hypothetical protein
MTWLAIETAVEGIRGWRLECWDKDAHFSVGMLWLADVVVFRWASS